MPVQAGCISPVLNPVKNRMCFDPVPVVFTFFIPSDATEHILLSF